MTVKQMALQGFQLPLSERLWLIEELMHSVREEFNHTITPVAEAPHHNGSSLERVLGMLKPDGPMPTDEELAEDYVNYLMEKYL